jgi:hypothetical protein
MAIAEAFHFVIVKYFQVMGIEMSPRLFDGIELIDCMTEKQEPKIRLINALMESLMFINVEEPKQMKLLYSFANKLDGTNWSKA